MDKEIEVRFLEIDKKNLIEKLTSLGATDKGETLLNETIFYDRNLSWIKEHRFIRIRNFGNTTYLTYKENVGQTIDSAHEIEFSISDPKKYEEFLIRLDLVPFRQQEKKRHTFFLENITIDIDTWPHVPTYVELEGPSTHALRSAAKHLGFNWSKAVFDDAKNIIENRYGIPISTMQNFIFPKSDNDKKNAEQARPASKSKKRSLTRHVRLG